MTKPLPPCVRCRAKNANRPRGLCWGCYYTPGVMDRYPSTSKYARRGVGTGATAYRRPAAPTLAVPGSEAKILVIMARVAAREEVDHPGDLKLWPGAGDT